MRHGQVFHQSVELKSTKGCRNTLAFYREMRPGFDQHSTFENKTVNICLNTCRNIASRVVILQIPHIEKVSQFSMPCK